MADSGSDRNGRGQWVSGHSGNPAGRPAVLRAVQRVAELYTADAVHVLARLMIDPAQPPARQLAAARTIVQWALGVARTERVRPAARLVDQARTVDAPALLAAAMQRVHEAPPRPRRRGSDLATGADQGERSATVQARR